jgi:HAE1 family hydrophobic/amphiphilic exporter-1
MFVQFFIKRPIFATVCALFIILAGAVSIPTLPIAEFPNLAPPQVLVASNYNGANAQQVETAVTIPLEQQINGAEGMKYMTSTSGNDGTSAITATFDITRDLDLAAVDVQNRVATALGRLPGPVTSTGVSVTKTSTSFVFAAGFYSEHNEYDSLFLSNYLDLYVRDALKRVKGVGDVEIFGARKYSMRLWLDPVRMASRGLTATDVVNALSEQNVQVPAGQIGQPPSQTGQAFQISVRALGRLTEPSEFGNIILKTAPDGSIVRVRDVGSAELGAEDYSSNLEFNGYPAVGVGVTQLSNANALQVDRDCKAVLEKLSRQFPPGMKYQIAFDTTTVVGESIRDVLYTLLQAIGLVVLVMFIFLQDWRSTLIPAVTIPVSLIGTFAFVKLLGFSINTLTLFGITLATGLVVDDAIVVIENVERHVREGMKDVFKATVVAMSEVTSAVIATSLVLVAVFVPVALFPGSTGILFRQFALTIAFSVSISAFNALTLTPALSAILMGRAEHPHGRFFTAFNRFVAVSTERYRAALHRLFNYKTAMATLFLIGLAATFWLFRVVPRSFVPEEDEGWFMTVIQAPQGASLEYTSRVARQVEAVFAKTPEIEGSFAVGGFNFAGNAPNRAMVFATMKDLRQRPGEEHSVDSVINRVRGPLSGISGAAVFPFAPPAIFGLGNFGGFQFVLQDLGQDTLQQFADITNKFVGDAGQDKKLTPLLNTFTANDPQYDVVIDREKAKSLQVSLSQIADALNVYLGSRYVNDFDFNNRSYRVYVQASSQFRAHPKDIRELYVRSQSGAMIPLDDLVKIEPSTTPQVITHYNMLRATELDGSPAPGYSSGDAITEMENLAAAKLPPSVTYEWTGLSLEEIESAGQSAALFGLGLLVVYLTLAALYESFSLPFIVLLGVPLAILGALGLQALRGLQDDVYCQIGLVMLIALASKNSILIVEFAEQLRAKGLSITEAAVEAARIRLRPILMTSLAFMLGVMPLVLATGAGRAGRHSVGTTVLGGMIAGTFLNLLFVPVLYIIMRSIRLRRAPATA